MEQNRTLYMERPLGSNAIIKMIVILWFGIIRNWAEVTSYWMVARTVQEEKTGLISASQLYDYLSVV